MAYAQINYPQIQGINGKYTIHDIGCFITGIANLLTLRFGHNVDPLSINNFLRDHNLYIDVDDGVRDDIDWNFVSFIDGNVKVTRTGPGRPISNKAIVKFIYRSISHPTLANGKPNMITHFCLWDGDGHFIDSWDGQRKAVGAYGEPVAFAEYDSLHVAPQPVTPPQVVNFSGKQLFLPSAAGTWRVYHEGGPYYVGKEIGKLTPGAPQFAPGLTYDILGNPQRYVYIIQTEKFGRVAIYAGPDTIAQFRDRPAPTPAPAPAPTPAPTPAPSAPAPAAEQPKPKNIVYTKLDAPLNLVVNKNPTKKWSLDFVDDVHATAIEAIQQGTSFVAYGKAQRTDGDKPCYYMTAEDFGSADTTGSPAHNAGVNTVDLTLQPPKLVINDNSGAPESNNNPVTTAAPDDNHVPVTVIPTAPDGWKTSFKVNAAGEYIAKTSLVIHELEGKGEDTQLLRGQTYHVAGTFSKDGVDYYRTKTSAKNGTWYGIPIIALQESSLDSDGDIFNDDVVDELRHELGNLNTREKIIKAVAGAETKKNSLVNFFSSIFNVFKRNKK